MSMAKKSKSLGTVSPDEEWQVEDDMRTLMRAKEIQADPKRMAKVKTLARKKLETVASVLGDVSESE
jgi:hypothetical protein